MEETGRGLGRDGAELSLLFGVLGSFSGRGESSALPSSSSSSSSILIGSTGAGVGGAAKSQGRGTSAAGIILYLESKQRSGDE